MEFMELDIMCLGDRRMKLRGWVWNGSLRGFDSFGNNCWIDSVKGCRLNFFDRGIFMGLKEKHKYRPKKGILSSVGTGRKARGEFWCCEPPTEAYAMDEEINWSLLLNNANVGAREVFCFCFVFPYFVSKEIKND